MVEWLFGEVRLCNGHIVHFPPIEKLVKCATANKLGWRRAAI